MSKSYRRWSALLIALVVIPVYCTRTTITAEAQNPESESSIEQKAQDEARLAPQPASKPATSLTQSQFIYAPSSHRWIDRHTGKPAVLGPPAFMNRYGVALLADNSTTSTQKTSGPSTGPKSTFKKYLLFTLVGLTVTAAITLPIVLSVHHSHHNDNRDAANQLAIYSYFHNQTLPTQHLVLPLPAPIIHSGVGGPGGPGPGPGPGGVGGTAAGPGGPIGPFP